MADDRSQQVTAARFPLQFAERELMMSPLSDRDIAEIDAWLRSRYLITVRESLAAETNQAIREESLRVANAEAMNISILSRAGAKMISTVDGMARIVWQACHMSHPGLTIEDVRALMMSPANVRMANAAFTKLNTAPKNMQARALRAKTARAKKTRKKTTKRRR